MHLVGRKSDSVLRRGRIAIAGPDARATAQYAQEGYCALRRAAASSALHVHGCALQAATRANLRKQRAERALSAPLPPTVVPAFIAGIHPSASAGPGGALDRGNKSRDDVACILAPRSHASRPPEASATLVALHHRDSRETPSNPKMTDTRIHVKQESQRSVTDPVKWIHVKHRPIDLPDYLPMQNRPKIADSTSSGSTRPVSRPSASAARRRSSAPSSACCQLTSTSASSASIACPR